MKSPSAFMSIFAHDQTAWKLKKLLSLLKSASEKNSQGFIAKKNQTFNQKLFPNENLGKKK